VIRVLRRIDPWSRHRGRALPPTTRQLEVLREYVEHGSYEAAANALGLSPQTVRHHLAALRQRLAVHTNIQAVFELWVTQSERRACPHPDVAERAFVD
jgi:DNA-binding CsgD family transcriptional regulator